MDWIDVHAHIIPRAILPLVQARQIPGITLEQRRGAQVLLFGERPHPCTPLFYDPQAQLDWMDRHGIRCQGISVAPRLFFYDLPISQAGALCRLMNQELLDRAREFPQRFFPVGTLPMQDIPAALQEVEFLHAQGVRMVQVGTTVNGVCLDDPRFRPLYERLAQYGMVLMLHPLIENRDPQTRRYHLSNLVGNPYQTTAAAGNLLFSGVLDRVPQLQVLLVHGGGFLLYQLGRMDHGFRMRPAAEHPCQQTPRAYLRRNFLFDGLTHDPQALGFLVALAGPDRVLFGTDYPYDMADEAQGRHFQSLNLGEAALGAFAHGNARRLFSLEQVHTGLDK